MNNCSQCHGCAYSAGAAAYLEPNNRLKGVLAALGGFVFFCHESMGWKSGLEGYPQGAENALAVLASRAKIAACIGEDPIQLSATARMLVKDLKVCGGWKKAVAKLKAAGWFSEPEITGIRRTMAKTAVQEISALDDVTDSIKNLRIRNIGETVEWFAQEARDAGVDIGWLLS